MSELHKRVNVHLLSTGHSIDMRVDIKFKCDLIKKTCSSKLDRGCNARLDRLEKSPKNHAFALFVDEKVVCNLAKLIERIFRQLEILHKTRRRSKGRDMQI